MGIGFIARPLLAAVFISGGYDQITNPGGRAQALETAMAEGPVPMGPDTAGLLVKANGVVMAGAGATMALGLFPRLSALALIGSLVPTSVVGHPFWKTEDPKSRSFHKSHLLKNAGLVGGLLLVASRRRKARPTSDGDAALV